MKVTDLICKARRKDNGELVEGFYFCLHHNDGRTHLHHLIIPLEADLSKGTPLDQIQVEVTPESIMLKAQEPRVMTITEAFDAEVAWLERYANPDDGVEPIIQPVIIRYYENGYWQCLIEQDESADLSLFLDGFGTEFRFWTSKPTDEQREAVKWE